jgi:2-polyprenyl-6-methoxyphenol hydroxylase-like FAD-dependent oxidoreductase
VKVDVLIAGAGPVGLTMAGELARYGVSVRIVDKAAQRTDKSKALVVWPRTLELMDRSGSGEKLIAVGMRVLAANIFAEDKQIVHLPLDEVDSPHPFALMLPQSETERVLDEHLNTYGVHVERSVELTGFSASDSAVTCGLRRADGTTESVECSWLIGCDGAHSTVRHTLGMKFVGDTLQTEWMLADVHLKGVPRPKEVTVMWHADGPLVVFPITEDRYRVIADMGEIQDDVRRPDPTLEEVQAILDRRGPGMQASDPVWLSCFQINERKVADYRAGRVFLAGDAAHIHSPAGGQGMNTGMQDACNLAWKLALVCQGLCKEELLLDSYSVERSVVGEQVLEAAGKTTQLAILRGGVKQAIRNHVASLVLGLAPVRKMAANIATELSIGYPKSPLTVHGPHEPKEPAAGERAPVHEGDAPIGAGVIPKFVLFADDNEGTRELMQRYSAFVDSELRLPFHEGGLWLVRPDGYVAVATRHYDWQVVDTLLGKLSAA